MRKDGENISPRQRLTEQAHAVILLERKQNKVPILVWDAPKTWVMVDPEEDNESVLERWDKIRNPVNPVVEGKKYSKLPKIKLNVR
jgi:hypothetical protein